MKWKIRSMRPKKAEWMQRLSMKWLNTDYWKKTPILGLNKVSWIEWYKKYKLLKSLLIRLLRHLIGIKMAKLALGSLEVHLKVWELFLLSKKSMQSCLFLIQTKMEKFHIKNLPDDWEEKESRVKPKKWESCVPYGWVSRGTDAVWKRLFIWWTTTRMEWSPWKNLPTTWLGWIWECRSKKSELLWNYSMQTKVRVSSWMNS